MIYLDHNATTQVHPAVREIVLSLLETPLNASSIHVNGRKAKNIIENAREQILGLVNIDSKARDYQVVFTSSGTEANNLMISSFKDADIFISAVEHLSIFALKDYFPNIKVIKVDSNGIVDLEDLERLLTTSSNRKKLVSVMLANNETGAIQPIQEIAKIATKFDALVHSDLIQGVGKIDIDIENLGVDFATISGHKFGSSLGAAALIAKLKHPLSPMIIGGGQERGQRSGSENVPAIAGMGLAAEIVKKELEGRSLKMRSLQKRLEQNLEDVKIIAQSTLRLPNTSLITTDNGFDAMTQLIGFDLRGLAVSSGAACSSGKVGQSHVLKAMGIDDVEIKSAIRVSVSHDNSFEDIDNFIKAFKEINARRDNY